MIRHLLGVFHLLYVDIVFFKLNHEQIADLFYFSLVSLLCTAIFNLYHLPRQ